MPRTREPINAAQRKAFSPLGQAGLSNGIENLATIGLVFAPTFRTRLDKQIAILTVPLDYIVTRFG